MIIVTQTPKTMYGVIGMLLGYLVSYGLIELHSIIYHGETLMLPDGILGFCITIALIIAPIGYIVYMITKM